MIMLLQFTTTSFYVVIESVVRLLCNVCGEKYPFASDLSSDQALHLQDKKCHCTYRKCGRKYKTKAELNRHCNYRHKQKSSKATIDKCVICNKTLQKSKYLKEHMMAHKEEIKN